MKEAVTKVVDTLTQYDFYGAFQTLLEGYKCIAGGGDYFERSLETYWRHLVPLRLAYIYLHHTGSSLYSGAQFHPVYNLLHNVIRYCIDSLMIFLLI